ncbi:hypothetical protein JCM11641_002780 [Rhodosporidiobolus odoratus]
MPAISPNSFVLLTGASGFLAAHIAHQLLSRGFRVRGTVRSEAKGKYLDDLFQKDGLNRDHKWEWVIVEDVEQEGAFDEAVKGVDAVLHTASPFHFRVNDPHKDLINPAVNGTLSALKAAKKEKGVKRVVITASFASVVSPYDPVYTFTEKDWNEYSPAQVEQHGAQTEPGQSYRASKTLAERAAWKFIEQEKPGFDITTVNPPLIFGPIIHHCESADKLNTSVNNFYNFLLGTKSAEDAQTGFGSFVDVRDVAKIHIEALVTEEAGNERFLVSHSDSSYQPLLDLFFSSAPQPLLSSFPNAQKGIPGKEKPKQNVIDAGKARRVFGWTPVDPKETIIDMAQSLADYQKKWEAAKAGTSTTGSRRPLIGWKLAFTLISIEFGFAGAVDTFNRKLLAPSPLAPPNLHARSSLSRLLPTLPEKYTRTQSPMAPLPGPRSYAAATSAYSPPDAVQPKPSTALLDSAQPANQHLLNAKQLAVVNHQSIPDDTQKCPPPRYDDGDEEREEGEGSEDKEGMVGKEGEGPGAPFPTRIKGVRGLREGQAEIREMEEKLAQPYIPRASLAATPEAPFGTQAGGWAEKHKHESVLQQHVAFWDKDQDGVIYPFDIFKGFHELGYSFPICIAAVFIICPLFCLFTFENVWQLVFGAISVRNIHRAKHGSDTGVYDAEGRFVPAMFEAIFARHDKGNKGGLTFVEGLKMIHRNRNVLDPVGWSAEFFELLATYILIWPKDGVIRKEDWRTVYDGSIFFSIAERERHRHANHAWFIDLIPILPGLFKENRAAPEPTPGHEISSRHKHGRGVSHGET